MGYDVDYFIAKFKAIPDTEWAVGTCRDEENRRCALGHCGIYPSEGGLVLATRESDALKYMFFRNGLKVVDVNDDKYKDITTPKGRILAALKDIKWRSE